MGVLSFFNRTFWFVVLTSDVLVLILFIAGFAAAYLHPSYYWPGSMIAIGLPLWVILLFLLGLLLALGRKWKWVGLHGVLLLLFLIRTGGWSFGTSILPSEGDLILMTMNAPRHPETDAAAHTILNLVKRYQPMILGVQESELFASKRTPQWVRGQKKFAAVIDSLRYKALPPPPNTLPKDWNSWRQPVLTTLPIIEQEQLVFRFEPDDAYPLYVVRTQFEWQGREAVHYNVHLRTYGDDKPWYKKEIKWFDLAFWRPYIGIARDAIRIRAWQADRLQERIEQETLPVIISGDFNSTPHGYPYHRLSNGLQDAFNEAGRGWGGTYPLSDPLVRIDFVLLSNEWEVVFAELPESHVDVSDHKPLVTGFRWRTLDP